MLYTVCRCQSNCLPSYCMCAHFCIQYVIGLWSISGKGRGLKGVNKRLITSNEAIKTWLDLLLDLNEEELVPLIKPVVLLYIHIPYILTAL